MNMNASAHRKDIGIAGLIVIATQGLTTYKTNDHITQQVDELRAQIGQSSLDREQYFLRKTDFQSMSQKIDKLSESVAKMEEKLSSISGRIADNFSLEECDLDFKQCDDKLVGEVASHGRGRAFR